MPRSARPDMPAGSGGQRNTSASACDGVLKPRVCRGRPLSSSAMASKSAWVRVRKSRVGAGTGAAARWCSRCCRAATGLGVAEVDLDAGRVGEPVVLGHLVALVPGQRLRELPGQGGDLRRPARRRPRRPCGSAGQRRPASRTGSMRSTRVATGLMRLPKTRSPSQCPGTARSSASAGRSEMLQRSPAGHHDRRAAGLPAGRRITRPVRRYAVSSLRSAPRDWMNRVR